MAAFEWGPAGARALVEAGAGAVAVVDVLSFTTAVTVAAGRGARVIPGPVDDDPVGGPVGGPVDDRPVGGPVDSPSPTATAWSPRRPLSPVGMASVPPGATVRLPSPNGSAISAWLAAQPGVKVLAACLRNSTAAASALARLAPSVRADQVGGIAVVAAGERWRDGSLRPAAEDLLGAGLLLDRLARAGLGLTPEARLAAAAARQLGPAGIAEVVLNCTSARELQDRGDGDDVVVAAELDVDAAVAVVQDGSFVRLARGVRWDG